MLFFVQKAVCYRHATEYDLSIYHYKIAIALDRIQPAYRRNLAYVYMQLKQWSKAVRAWSGAIEVSDARSKPELYRNRAFAQAERGYLAIACEDMSIACELYTSSQQRKRCREKLERWSSRLQGTEQAYLRAQQQLVVTQHDDANEANSDVELGSDEDGGSMYNNDGTKNLRRRAKIRQLAGLIQGEWEEWHGEDRDDSTEDEDENGEGEIDGASAIRRKLKSASSSAASNFASRNRPRLDIVKRSRHAPASTLLVRGRYDSYQEYEDEQRFLSTSSSTYVKNLIRETGLDIPYHVKIEREEREHRARLEEEERRRLEAERETQKRRRFEEKLARSEERRRERKRQKEEAKLRKQQQQPQPLSTEHPASGESKTNDRESADSNSDDSSSYLSPDSDSDSQTDSDDDDGDDSNPSKVSFSLPPSSSPSTIHTPPSVQSPSTHSRSRSITNLGQLDAAAASASTAAASSTDALDADLYAEDDVDPYSSLAKLFIRLRIDSKYLWRFEDAKIHLHNIHLVNESELRRVLPPLGPRLTLMNFLQDRITRLRHSQPRIGGDGPSCGASSNSSVAELELTKTHVAWQRARSGRREIETTPRRSIEEEAARITSTLQIRRRRSKSRDGKTNATPPTPIPRLPINSVPIVPVSPHNNVIVHRPLSARDRRILYDSHTNPRSSMTPIKTIGSANWRN